MISLELKRLIQHAEASDTAERLMYSDCPLAGARVVNTETGEAIRPDCKQWKCGRHGAMVGYRWAERVKDSIGTRGWYLMLTITQVPEDRDQAALSWQQFIRDARKLWGFRHYVRALERGSDTGMLHYHVAIDSVRFVPKPALNRLVRKYGYGEVCWISYKHWMNQHLTPYQRMAKLADYLSKYLTKAGTKVAMAPRARRITTSRGCLRSWADVLLDRRRVRLLGNEETRSGVFKMVWPGHLASNGLRASLVAAQKIKAEGRVLQDRWANRMEAIRSGRIMATTRRDILCLSE